MEAKTKYGGIDLVTSITGYSKSRIYKLVMANRIPVHRIPGGSKLLFFEDEILNWIRSGNVHEKKTADELTSTVSLAMDTKHTTNSGV